MARKQTLSGLAEGIMASEARRCPMCGQPDEKVKMNGKATRLPLRWLGRSRRDGIQ